MGLSRRFLNLIVDNGTPGSRSLSCIDPARFFNKTHNKNRSEESKGLQNTTTCASAAGAGSQKNNKQAVEAALKMGSLQLPNPIFNLEASRSDLSEQWKIDCFPLVDRRVICADHWGRCFLFEADTRLVETMPHLHEPKSMPISLFIPSRDVDDLKDGTGGTLFIMERIPKPHVDNQFEAFVYCKPRANSFFKSWVCQPLSLPPYLCNTTLCHPYPEISCYGVIGDGSHIFISVEGIGTYFLDTDSHTWSDVRKWTLPFYGKVEYAPDLNLWFGLSASANARVLLAAANLSMDSQPQLLGDCKELDRPEEWKQCNDPQLVNLGSRKLCIARFFDIKTANGDSGDELVEQKLAVLTGVEVVPRVGNGSRGNVELRMIPRKSECHTSNGTGVIQAVF